VGLTLALVDDHELVRQGLDAWLSASGPALTVLATAATVADLAGTAGWGADVVLLDLCLGDGSTVEDNIAALRSGGMQVVVVSQNDDPAVVRRSLRAGAAGYVPKSASAEEMTEAVDAAASGRTYMTESLAVALLTAPAERRPELSGQELRTLRMYAGGMPLKSVALRLQVRPDTVKSYVDRIREKYQAVGREAPTKIDLYRRAVEDGLLADGEVGG
jgi:two-component system, NarL family, nitrate/nitrite response regulator NarL